MTVKGVLVLAAVVVSGISATRVAMPVPAGKNCYKEICTVRMHDESMLSYLSIPCISYEGWDTTAEVKFWRKIITLDKDSSMANVFGTRQLLEAIPRSLVDSMEKLGKLDTLRLQMCRKYGLSEDTRIKFTGGKKWFYQKYDVINSVLGRAIDLFDSFGVDPFYAQSVLLIESPGSSTTKSISGAYGHFQLMPFVARQYGLRVDRYVDERENFGRSAYAAARLFKEICIPYAKEWCNQMGYIPDESAIWFKLLVLHCYNAGCTTVKYAMQQVQHASTGDELIRSLWHTNYRAFQFSAQSYSQVALACYLEYETHLRTFSTVSAEIYNRF